MLQRKPKALGYFSAPVPAPRLAANQALLEYWTSKRGDDGLMAREDISPVDIARQLPGIFIAEETGGDFRFRLAGSDIEGWMQRKLTGVTLTEVFGPELGAKTASTYRSVVETGEPLVLVGNYVGDNLEHIEFEVLHLPIRFQCGTRGVFGGQFTGLQLI